MNKKSNRKLLVFASIILIISLLFTLTACKKTETPSDNNSETEQSTLENATVVDTVTNGSFYTTSGTDYPLTPGTWTKTAGQTSGTYKTPSTADDVMSGVISLYESSYRDNSGIWSSTKDGQVIAAPANPNLQKKDSPDEDGWEYVADKNDYNVLMIYNKYNNAYSDYLNEDGTAKENMPKGTAYYYKNSSISFASGRYYRLTVSVYTTGRESALLSGDENKGAYINLNSGKGITFKSIETEATWKTYSIYIMSNPSSSTSATLTLGLGYGDTTSRCMTQGYAFFDSVRLDSITKAEYEAVTDDEYNATLDLRLVNGGFDVDDSYTKISSSSSTASAPNGYKISGATAIKEGTSDSSLSSTYGIAGVINASVDNAQELTKIFSKESDSATNSFFVNAKTDSVQTTLQKLYNNNGKSTDSVLVMINKSTASGYENGYSSVVKSNNTVTVPVGKVVKISVDVFTWLMNDDADTNKLRGVTLKLSSSNSENDLSSTIKADQEDPSTWQVINTNATWKTYSFYVIGSSFEAYNYTVELYLGQGSKDEKDYHTSGAAFFDNLTFEVVDDELATELKNYQTMSDSRLAELNIIKGSTMVKDFSQAVDNKIVGGDFGANVDTSWEYGLAGVLDNSVNYVLAQEGVDYKAGVLTKADTTDVELLKNSWKLGDESAQKVGVPYDSAENVFAIGLINPSAYELRLKEDAKVEINKNTYYKISLWVKTIDIKSGSGLTIALIDKDGTSLSSFTAVNTQDYTHYLFNDYCQYTFYVEGDYLDSSTVSLKITFGTGSRVSTDSFLSGYAFISSVNMSRMEPSDYSSATTGTYAKKYSFTSTRGNIANGLFYIFDTTETEYNTETGELTTTPGALESWTQTTDNTDVDEKVLAGIVNVNDSVLMNTLGLDKDQVYNAWYSQDNQGFLTTGNAVIGDGKPSFLYVKATKNGIKPIGYKSTSISMDASSYYVFYVDVKTIGNAKASVYMSTSSVADSTTKFTNISTNDNGTDTWTRFCMGIDVGMYSSVSINITLYLGAEKTAPEGTYDGSEGYDASNAFIKEGDTVFFDNVRYVKYSSKEDYEAALSKFDENYAQDTTLNEQQEIKTSATLTTDTFDTFGSVTSSVSPFPAVNSSNLSGSFASSAPSTKSDAIMGVIAKDVSEETLTNETGVTLKVENSEEEQEPVRQHALTAADINSLFASDLFDVGNHVVIIDNLNATAYSYTMSTKHTLSDGKYYELSIWVATYGIKDGSGAFVKLTSGTNSETQTYTNINPEKLDAEKGQYSMSKWQKYTFYLKNLSKASITSTYLTFGLGQTSDTDVADANYVQGIAFFDNITVREITEAEYNVYATDIPSPEADENGEVAKRQGVEYEYFYNEATKTYERSLGDVALGTAWIVEFEPAPVADTDDDTTDTDNSSSVPTSSTSNLDWQYFTYIAISVALILAVVVVIIRRYAPKKKAKQINTTPTYSKNSTTPKDDKSTQKRTSDYNAQKEQIGKKKKKK